MKKVITVLIISMLLTACSEITRYAYNFTGESEHWEAEYAYEGKEKWGEKDGQRTYSNEASHKFILKYKGPIEELASLQRINYSYETNSRSESITKEFTEPPTTGIFTLLGGSGSGAKVREDEVITVNVKWDDFEESFELVNSNVRR